MFSDRVGHPSMRDLAEVWSLDDMDDAHLLLDALDAAEG